MKNQHRVTGPVSEIGREAWRARVRFSFAVALALSLNFHGFILSLEFGELGFGLPGFSLPRTERRVPAPDLTVRLVKAPAPTPESVPTRDLPLVAAASKPLKPKEPPRADKSFEVLAPAPARVAPPEAPLSLPRRESRVAVPAAETRDREPEIQARPQPEILAQDKPREETFSVPPPAPPVPELSRAPEIAARKQPEEPPPAAQEAEEAEARRKAEVESRKEDEARREAEEQARQRALALEEARRKAEEAEARRKAEGERRKEDEARQVAEEQARQRALALEETRRKAEVEEAIRKAEVERRKEEEAKRIAVEAEALRRAEEAARQQAAAQRERERLAAEQAAARAAAGADTPGAPSGRDLAAKALGQLRAPAVPFDPPRPPPKPADDPRRRSIIGEERDIVLRMYVESWRTKIERNGPLNYRPSAGMRAPDYPVVTVSIRSDGSLEDVHIHRSSGLRELDDAVRRIVRLYAPYSAFPPSLARQFDVIEIRRVWQFDGMLRIVEETR